MPVTGNTEQTQPENRAFFPALDGLRGIAFFLVFLQHYLSFPWGWTGVNIFFVLSGFLITGILYDTRDAPHRARSFYIRRGLRIFPLYYGLWIILLLITPLLHWRWSWAWLAWPLYLGNFLRFVLPGSVVFGSPAEIVADAQLPSTIAPPLFMGHLWSLCVEEQFYLIWPWLVFWIRRRDLLLWICGIAVVVVPCLRILARQTAAPWLLHQEILYRLLPFQLDALLLGGFVALLWRSSARHSMVRASRWIAAGAALVAIAYMARTIHPSDQNWCYDYRYPVWRFTWALSFADVLAAAVIVCCLHPAGWLTRCLSFRPLRAIGRISYGAYIFHDLYHAEIRSLFTELGQHIPFLQRHAMLAIAISGMTVTLLLASLSYRYFETPFLNLKERLSPPIRKVTTSS
jgi:peptidoglycan/LPS O-acetylase OafA/YrhL